MAGVLRCMLLSTSFSAIDSTGCAEDPNDSLTKVPTPFKVNMLMMESWQIPSDLQPHSQTQNVSCKVLNALDAFL